MSKEKALLIKAVSALAGIFLIGIGVAFNAMAHLGNDPVGIFYDGVRNALGLTQVQLGTASNLVNIALVILLFFIGRHYVNIGTFIYIIPYGYFVNLGCRIFQIFFTDQFLIQQIAASFIGISCIYIGVAIFIAMDVGVDPMTGVTLVLGEKINWQYGKAKVLFDVTITTIGFLMGGKLGIITLICAATAGPCIQYLSKQIEGIYQLKIWKQETF